MSESYYKHDEHNSDPIHQIKRHVEDSLCPLRPNPSSFEIPTHLCLKDQSAVIMLKSMPSQKRDKSFRRWGKKGFPVEIQNRFCSLLK